MTQISITLPRPVAAPRGAALAGELFSRALVASQALLQDWQAQRAQAKLRAEAAALRRYAYDVSRYDPSFAADLLMAADRHLGDR